jgi:phosphodiester glycosidase
MNAPTRPPRFGTAAKAFTLLVLALIALLVARRGTGTQWRPVFPGGEFAIVNGEPWCRRGPSRVAVLRIDPSRVRLRVHHSRPLQAAAPPPPSIAEWERTTGALAMFNAGQFYENWAYMGLLVSGGRVISRSTHPGYRAALVAEPRSGPHTARVIDLDREPLRPDSLPWGEVAQSFMLFDRGGAVRVRRSDRVANRTAVGEDRHGRLLIVTSEGGYTLHDFAELLRDGPLGLTHAMSMDGGAEAQLCVRAGRFRYASFGRWENDTDPVDAPGAHTPLPTVVGVYGR